MSLIRLSYFLAMSYTLCSAAVYYDITKSIEEGKGFMPEVDPEKEEFKNHEPVFIEKVELKTPTDDEIKLRIKGAINKAILEELKGLFMEGVQFNYKFEFEIEKTSEKIQ